MPDVLRVVATIPVTAEGVAAAGPALAALAAASQRDEEGCLGYEVYESASVPGTFVTIESWRSEDDMNAHMSTPHVAEAFGVLGPVLAGELGLHPLKPLA
ncbi:MAG: putative quinol monooxygenase [Nocardioides sp.]|nr:putative quinol monooxygenase [Nocardioides sp.]